MAVVAILKWQLSQTTVMETGIIRLQWYVLQQNYRSVVSKLEKSNHYIVDASVSSLLSVRIIIVLLFFHS